MANKVVTGKVRFSYCNVWTPKSFNGGAEEYSVSLIIPKADKATVKKIQEAVEKAKQEGIEKFGKGFASARNFHLPLRDGDIERPEDAVYANSYFLNTKAREQPKIVDRRREEILDSREVYSGCYGFASINIYPFSKNGNCGVSSSLNALQKIEDGEPLDGRSRVEDDFEILDEDDDDFLS